MSTNDAATPTSTQGKHNPTSFPQVQKTSDIYVALTYEPLDTSSYLRFARSPTAGANILFLGTTRDSFIPSHTSDPAGRPVTHLTYTTYPALALRTLFRVATQAKEKHNLEKVVIVHRLGDVAVGEESIAVCVSSGHRGQGWKGAEDILEKVKEGVEIWKREWMGEKLVDGQEGQEGVWRANNERDASGRLKEGSSITDEGGYRGAGGENDTNST